LGGKLFLTRAILLSVGMILGILAPFYVTYMSSCLKFSECRIVPSKLIMIIG
jgi:hypothetical protein